MAERLGIDSEEEFNEMSMDIEDAWRIVTRPKEYSRYKVRKAQNFLDNTRTKLLSAITMDATDEEIDDYDDLMLGLYHYGGPRIVGNPDLN
jgi:hypothetical protein